MPNCLGDRQLLAGSGRGSGDTIPNYLGERQD